MIRLILANLILAGILLNTAIGSETKVSPSKESQDKGHAEEAHNHAEGEEGEAESGSIGPDKGIMEANELSGFKLSPEALKNFDLKLKKLTGDGPWEIPSTSIVHAGEEVNLFRLRKGFFKRIDFQTIRKLPSGAPIVDSDDMREGDEIVIVGIGFLRIAELAAFGGVAHGHSH